MKKKILYLLLSFIFVISFSCKEYLTVKPEGFVLASQTFKNADDAISAVAGLYGLMQPLVDQIYLAGEAQGDLVVAARGADKYIAEIAQNRVTPQNPYTDYTNFYKLIVACNNALTGIGNILKVDRVNYGLGKYNFDVAEIKYIRAWTYLQLVKIWKDVPYISTEITSVDQITAVAPEKSDVILGRILKDAIDNFDQLQIARLPSTSSFADVLTSRSQFTAQSARFLLTEIYLYQGNYAQAWETILPMLPFGERDNETLKGISPSLSPRFWHEKINGYMPEALYKEWGLYIDFDGSKGQKNSLQRWTNNKNGGIYALKPSTNSIANWSKTPMMLLTYQITNLGLYFNYLYPRGYNYVSDSEGYPVQGCPSDSTRGKGFSYNIDGQDTLIFKYLLNTRFVARNILQGNPHSNDDAQFLLYRTGPFFLKTIEILNNMGLSLQALAYLNGNDAIGVESTRSRVWCMPFKLDANGEAPTIQVNRFILEELALEGAYEGIRWFDLVRFAERSGYQSWVGEYVSKKYPADQQQAIKSRLSNPAYWYFPYYYKNVITNTLLQQKTGY